MTPEECKQIHGTEILFKIDWMTAPCHSLVLSHPELGTSVKPLFIDKKEENQIISDFAFKIGECFEEAKRRIHHPRYCFMWVGGDVSFDFLQDILNDNSVLNRIQTGSGPSCPFY
jgi:hypothetical protein